MPDGVENSSLQTAAIEEMREDSLAEAAIDGGSELDEEKNESEIMNVNSGRFIANRYLSFDRKWRYSHVRETYSRKKVVFAQNIDHASRFYIREKLIRDVLLFIENL